MKLKRTSARAITAATSAGTTYYRATLQDVEDAIQNDTAANIWILKSFQELGWDAIDFKQGLFGSQIIDDDLYICETDGRDINVDGDMIDPESALLDYDIRQLSAYVEDATDDIILRYITTYEIKTPDFDKWAPDLLDDGNTFLQLADAAREFDID